MLALVFRKFQSFCEQVFLVHRVLFQNALHTVPLLRQRWKIARLNRAVLKQLGLIHVSVLE